MNTRLNHAVLVIATAAFAVVSAGCNLSVETIMEMQPGSEMIMTIPPTEPIPMPLEGGVVMDIEVSLGILDLLHGEVGGDVAVRDLLFATPPFNVLGLPNLNTEEVCIVVAEGGAAGGMFEADIFGGTAAFDVAIDTIALLGSESLAAVLPGGGFAFPFDLNATIPLGLTDMLGLLTGSGNLSITQMLDLPLTIEIGPTVLEAQITGELTLASAEAFPTSPLLDTCIAFLNE